jgi:nucleotide-binding universal stress UspA family protein
VPAVDVRNGPQARAIAREIETIVEAARSRALGAVNYAHQLVDEAIQFLTTNFPAWELHGQAMVGDPSSAILKEAVQWSIELIVVGTHGRSAVGRLLLGSVSCEIAVAARCSVRVARCLVERRDLPIRILIGFDGSGGAQTVVKQLTLRTWPAGSEAFLVALDENGKPTEEMKVRELIAVAKEDLRAVAGLHVSSKIVEGDWERVLIAEARRIGADCIFVSSGSSMNDHNAARPGIVSAALLNGAPCSVEVVRQRQARH